MVSSDNMNNSYLTFKLTNELYAICVSQTIKILQLSEITHVPNAPDSMKGVINHHGNVLPVIDLNQTLGLPETVRAKNTCIIILSVVSQSKEINFGAIVDEVLTVESIEDEQISPPPTLGNSNPLEHIQGVFKKDDQFIMILNIPMMFTHMDIKVA
jgi:purine-binding chemotaxis protein CheW